jgi:hypothetical protein
MLETFRDFIPIAKDCFREIDVLLKGACDDNTYADYLEYIFPEQDIFFQRDEFNLTAGNMFVNIFLTRLYFDFKSSLPFLCYISGLDEKSMTTWEKVDYCKVVRNVNKLEKQFALHDKLHNALVSENTKSNDDDIEQSNIRKMKI